MQIETVSSPSRPDSSAILTYREALYRSMHNALAHYDHTVIVGQGSDDFKGIFGSTIGLAEKFGAHRVLDTPLAEEGVTGIMIGAALNGLYPINTHIRADFALLAMNQIINLAAKYKYMFGGRFEVPLLIRMVIGRSWGQGAQHSQSLQSLFAHIPGLLVVMPSNAHSILDTYGGIIGRFRGPVISFEHRLLYDLQFQSDSAPAGSVLSARKLRSGSDITIVATSIMVLEAMRAAAYLQTEHGIDCEVIDLHCVSHIDRETVLSSVAKTGKLLVADTSWQAYGVAAEVCRLVCETDPGMLRAPAVTMGMQPAPCPTAKSLEDLYYPSQQTLVDAIARLVTGHADHGVRLPDETSMADVYKRFKGPF